MLLSNFRSTSGTTSLPDLEDKVYPQSQGRTGRSRRSGGRSIWLPFIEPCGEHRMGKVIMGKDVRISVPKDMENNYLAREKCLSLSDSTILLDRKTWTRHEQRLFSNLSLSTTHTTATMLRNHSGV